MTEQPERHEAVAARLARRSAREDLLKGQLHAQLAIVEALQEISGELAMLRGELAVGREMR